MNVLECVKIHSYTDCVSDGRNFKYVCQSEFVTVFMDFNLWIGPSFIFDLCS